MTKPETTKKKMIKSETYNDLYDETKVYLKARLKLLDAARKNVDELEKEIELVQYRLERLSKAL